MTLVQQLINCILSLTHATRCNLKKNNDSVAHSYANTFLETALSLISSQVSHALTATPFMDRGLIGGVEISDGKLPIASMTLLSLKQYLLN